MSFANVVELDRTGQLLVSNSGAPKALATVPRIDCGFRYPPKPHAQNTLIAFPFHRMSRKHLSCHQNGGPPQAERRLVAAVYTRTVGKEICMSPEQAAGEMVSLIWESNRDGACESDL
jgi:hypothetical protein